LCSVLFESFHVLSDSQLTLSAVVSMSVIQVAFARSTVRAARGASDLLAGLAWRALDSGLN
jgi:hypothetical protein